MPTYLAYGLAVESELRLPELEPIQADPDVHVRIGEVSAPAVSSIADGKLYQVSDGHYATVRGIGSLHAVDGHSLVVDPDPDADPKLIRQFLLGQGFRTLLYQRGYVVLHASSAVIDGDAVAFLGKSGQGKSTTLAACYADGYPVLADDVVAVDPETCEVLPGFPQVKLTPEVAEEVVDINSSKADSEDNEHHEERRYYDVNRQFRDEPAPLRAIYLLEDGEEVHIESLPLTKRPYELMCASVSDYQRGEDDTVKPHLDACISLSEQVPVKLLERPRRFDALPELIQSVKAEQAISESRQATE